MEAFKYNMDYFSLDIGSKEMVFLFIYLIFFVGSGGGIMQPLP